MEELIRRCYRKICSDFFYAHRCIRNNHTLSELCGMILGAWCFGEEARLKKAYRWLNEEIRRQFFADGGYVSIPTHIRGWPCSSWNLF